LKGDSNNTDMHVIKKEEVARGGDASNIGFGKKPVFKAKPKAGEN
jgi:hypothetical protein